MNGNIDFSARQRRFATKRVSKSAGFVPPWNWFLSWYGCDRVLFTETALWSGLEKYLIRRSLRAFPQTAGPVRL
jgi:hypothetical protein